MNWLHNKASTHRLTSSIESSIKNMPWNLLIEWKIGKTRHGREHRGNQNNKPCSSWGIRVVFTTQINLRSTPTQLQAQLTRPSKEVEKEASAIQIMKPHRTSQWIKLKTKVMIKFAHRQCQAKLCRLPEEEGDRGSKVKLLFHLHK